MSLLDFVRFWLLLGVLVFTVPGICTNSDIFEDMHEVDHRVYARGLDHLPVLANRLLVRGASEDTGATVGSPVDTVHIALDATQTVSLVETQIKCDRCNPQATETATAPDPTVAETTTEKSTVSRSVSTTGKSSVSATATEKSTVSATSKHTSTTLVSTEDSSCSAQPTEPTTGPVAIPTEVPTCSGQPTESTTGPVPAPTEKSTASWMPTGKTAIEKTSTDTDTETICTVGPTDLTTGPVPASTGKPTGAGTVTECSAGTPCTVALTKPTKGTVPVPTETRATQSSGSTQPSAGVTSHTEASTHIEITIPLVPTQEGSNTLSTLITLVTSKGGLDSTSVSQKTTPAHSTMPTPSGGTHTTTTSQHTQGSGVGVSVTGHTGTGPHFTANTGAPSPTYNGGNSAKESMSSCICASIILLFFFNAL